MQKINSKIESTVPKIIKETLPSHTCKNIEKVFCKKLPVYKESTSATSVVEQPADTMNQFIINSIPETGSSFLSQFESDTKIIEEVLDKVGSKAEGNIKEARRLGKKKIPDTDECRQCRPLLISTDNPYFMEQCFARSHYLKNFRLTVYIKKILTRAEGDVEKKLLSKRYNMINEGKNRTNFRIKKVQLFHKGKLVDLSEETQGLTPINYLLLNCQSRRSQQKRHKLLKLVNCNLLYLTETWLSMKL